LSSFFAPFVDTTRLWTGQRSSTVPVVSKSREQNLHLTAEADQVFLSPRVVDERAFEDFAARLRELVDKAAASGAALRASTAEIRAAKATLEELGATYKRELANAGALLEQVQGRRNEVQQLLDRVPAHMLDPVSFDRLLDEAMSDRLAVFETKLAACIDTFVTELDQRIEARRSEIRDLLAEAGSVEALANRHAEFIIDAVRSRMWADIRRFVSEADANETNPSRSETAYDGPPQIVVLAVSPERNLACGAD